MFLSLPNLTIKNHPPDFALRLWSTERGRRNTKPLVGIGPGSAARRTFRASRRESVKIRIFWGGQYYYILLLSPIYYCRWNLFMSFRAPILLEHT